MTHFVSVYKGFSYLVFIITIILYGIIHKYDSLYWKLYT